MHKRVVDQNMQANIKGRAAQSIVDACISAMAAVNCGVPLVTSTALRVSARRRRKEATVAISAGR